MHDDRDVRWRGANDTGRDVAERDLLERPVDRDIGYGARRSDDSWGALNGSDDRLGCEHQGPVEGPIEGLVRVLDADQGAHGASTLGSTGTDRVRGSGVTTTV